MVANCTVCTSALGTQSHIQCSFCEKFFHLKCVSLTKTQSAVSVNDGFLWKCVLCRAVKVDNKDNQHLEAGSSSGCEGCKLIPKILTMFEKLEKAVDHLRLQMSSSKPVENHSMSIDNVVHEVIERQKRKNNIIFFGIPEQNAGAAAEVRLKQDATFIKEFVNLAAPDINISIDSLKPIRLGKFNAQSNSPRPVKITLVDDAQVFSILKMANKINKQILRGSPLFKNVFVSADRTEIQRDYYKKIKASLMERTRAGEVGLKIRYVNDVPQIVKTQSN